MNRNDTREYELVRRADTTDGEWEECSCCGYPAPLHDYNSDPIKIDGGPEWICRLCANVVKSRNPEVARIQKTLLNIGNTILAVLEQESWRVAFSDNLLDQAQVEQRRLEAEVAGLKRELARHGEG